MSTTTKFTPGEWKAGDSLTVFAGKTDIADVLTNADDARLISVARELYEALAEVVAEHGTTRIYRKDRRRKVQLELISSHEVATPSMKKARAALAKVEAPRG